jgi:hypothetical protein
MRTGHGMRSNVMFQTVEQLGHRAEPVADGATEPEPGDVLVMTGSANYYPATFRRLLAEPPGRRPLSVLWHNEPLPAPAASGLRPARRHAREWAKVALGDRRVNDPRSNFRRLAELQRAGLPDLIVASTPWRRTFLEEQGIEAAWVPIGYHEQMGHDLGLERDIDVMFVGAQDVPRRRRLIRRLRRAGLDVRTEGAWTPEGLWGERRTEVLNRTKLLLNLSRHPGELSGQRFLIGMANRCCVLSEPAWDPRPFVPGVHYAEATVDELAAAAQALLADDARRQAIADAGHELALGMPLSDSMASIVRLAEEGLARRRASPRPAAPSTAPAP